MEKQLIISSDCHAGLPPGEYRGYLDPKYRDAFDIAHAEQIKATKEAEKHFLIKDINEEWRQGREQVLTGAWDSKQRLNVLDDEGIAAEVIFPDGITEMNAPPFGAGIGLSPIGADKDLQWAGARAHNRWLAEFCQMSPARRHGVAVIPATWDVAIAIEEVKWAKANGLGSIMLSVLWGEHKPYHHPCYDPLWALCEELDMVVHFHSGPADNSAYFGGWPPQGEITRGAMGIYLSEVAWWVVRPLTFMIWAGVFEIYPKLKVAITEASAHWIPYYLWLLDQRAGDHAGAAKLGDFSSHLKLKPSEYFARNVRVGAMLPKNEVEKRHDVGVDVLMWGSDFPHPEGTWPHTQELRVDAMRGVPDAERDAMLGLNAANFYGFDCDALAAVVQQIGPEKHLFNP